MNADEKTICPDCESEDVFMTLEEQQFSYGDDIRQPIKKIIAHDVPVYTCRTCKFQWTDGTGEVVRHDAVCRGLGRLRPSEIKEFREKLGYTQAQLAAAVNVVPEMISAIERGACLQNPEVDQKLRKIRRDGRIV